MILTEIKISLSFLDPQVSFTILPTGSEVIPTGTVRIDTGRIEQLKNLAEAIAAEFRSAN